jgi:hypothetical protein
MAAYERAIELLKGREATSLKAGKVMAVKSSRSLGFDVL